MRAFGAHWSGADDEILLVVAVYKKSEERRFWARRDEFQATVKDYFDVFDELEETGQIREWISRAKKSNEFFVCESG